MITGYLQNKMEASVFLAKPFGLVVFIFWFSPSYIGAKLIYIVKPIELAIICVPHRIWQNRLTCWICWVVSSMRKARIFRCLGRECRLYKQWRFKSCSLLWNMAKGWHIPHWHLKCLITGIGIWKNIAGGKVDK